MGNLYTWGIALSNKSSLNCEADRFAQNEYAKLKLEKKNNFLRTVWNKCRLYEILYYKT